MLGQRNTRHGLSKCLARMRSQCGVTMATRCVFRALPCLVARIYMHDRQRHLKLRAHRTTVRFKIICSSLQPMVHMNGVHLARPTPGTGMQ